MAPQPDHDAAERGIRAMQHSKRTDPALYRWVTEGHPNLSEEEHLEWFGEPYRSFRSRRKGVSP